MKSILKILFLLLLPFFVLAQSKQKQLDSLHFALQHTANDSSRLEVYYNLGFFYDDLNLDSSVYYNEKGIEIARQLEFKLNEAEMLMALSFPLTKMGNYPRSLKVLMQASAIAEDLSNEKSSAYLFKKQTPQKYRLSTLGYIQLALGYLYINTGNYEKAIATYPEGIRIAEILKDNLLFADMYSDRGLAYSNLNKLDSALLSYQKSLAYFSLLPFDERKFEGDVYSGIGSIYQQMKKLDLAKRNYEESIYVSEQHSNPALAGEAYMKLAKLCQILNNGDSSLHFAKKALDAFTIVGKGKFMADAYQLISDIYAEHKSRDSSYTYLSLAAALNDSLDKSEKKKLQEYQAIGFNEQLHLQQLEKEKVKTQTDIRTYAMLAGIGVFMVIAFLLYRNNRNRRKSNEVLQMQKEELQSALAELKSTQAQLIQSEKMASLGELTAGIAHEIQNPLNFVNNFAEVNRELAGELEDELANGNQQLAVELAADIKENSEKINHHGKRADAIVKGMLQHSRSTSSVKEPTDINALTDEYLWLAYQGLRAKDKSFNAVVKTEYDDSIGKVAIIPQDIGRVVLNIIINAFYAVNEKKKLVAEGYEPTISITTKKTGANIAITVKDNGSGIPQRIIDKIFQPFFTTKPTGQGTGLGLSLSYDIIRTHAGEIRVETQEGEGTIFIVQLPIV